jgi:short subunit dehydrogenase-like uncharacterized protein
MISVQCLDEIKGGISGGTFATIFESLEDRQKYKSTTCAGFDPLLKVFPPAAAAKSQCHTAIANQSFLGYSSERGVWVGPFVMAAVMGNCIKRSNALLRYGPRLTYREAVQYSSCCAGAVEVFMLIALGTALVFPPLNWLLRACVLVRDPPHAMLWAHPPTLPAPPLCAALPPF